MKSSSVRGTPVRHVGTSGTRTEGQMHGAKPQGYNGTVKRQFEGDQTQNRMNGATGTPYHSQDGNSDEFKRTVSHGKYGVSRNGSAGDQQDPHANGSGVILDGVTQGRGMDARPERTMDSPVPDHAPEFDSGFINAENRAHLGVGGIGEDLDAIGGVMSRGMRGTSRANGPEDELTDDDTLRGSTGSSAHEKE